MIGEFGELIDEAPYLLEHLVDGFAEEAAAVVRLEVRAVGLLVRLLQFLFLL